MIYLALIVLCISSVTGQDSDENTVEFYTGGGKGWVSFLNLRASVGEPTTTTTTKKPIQKPRKLPLSLRIKVVNEERRVFKIEELTTTAATTTTTISTTTSSVPASEAPIDDRWPKFEEVFPNIANELSTTLLPSDFDPDIPEAATVLPPATIEYNTRTETSVTPSNLITETTENSFGLKTDATILSSDITSQTSTIPTEILNEVSTESPDGFETVLLRAPVEQEDEQTQKSTDTIDKVAISDESITGENSIESPVKSQSSEETFDSNDDVVNEEEHLLYTEDNNSSLFTNDTMEANETAIRMISILDESGRVGPNFEVREVQMWMDNSSHPITIVDHGFLDATLLERETMVMAMNDTQATFLRDRLSNRSILEEDRGESHRDYGSSYILPVLSSVNYDNNTVPLAFSDIPVQVAVKLNVLHLANFDSQLMEYSIDMEMELSWIDLRLSNNYTKPIRIREKPILDLIWRPDPYLVNSKHAYFHYVSFPNFRMRINPDGLVTYTMRITSTNNCFMLFCLYPHDRQICDLRISSIAFPSTFVKFHWHSEPIVFQSSIALPELHIQDIKTEECIVEGKLVLSSCLRLIFLLERDGGRFVVEKYIPSTLAMMFAWVAPYVPYNYEDVRIITPITVLLTLVQMEKGGKEIRTSYLTSMDLWFAAMKSFTVLSLVESLAVLALIKRSRAMEKSATRAPSELYRENCLQERRRLTRLYHRMDRLARIISPLVFLVFFVYYVLFIAQGDKNSCVESRLVV